MAKINNFRRINVGEYDSDYAELISTLASSLNPFMREVTDEINGNLDFDNLAENIIEFTGIILDSTGKPNNNQWNTGIAAPRGFSVINARPVNSNSTDLPTGTPFISFTPTGNQVVSINKISNIPSNVPYVMTVIVY